jgi:hypothetical protein
MLSVLNRKVSIINWPNDSAFVFFHISALQDPIAARGRKPVYWIKSHAWIAPRAAGIVNAHRLVHFDLAIHRFRRRQRDFPERNANVYMQFPRNVNLFGIWKLVVPTCRDARGFCRSVSITGVNSARRTAISGYKFVSIRVHSWLTKSHARSRAWLKCQSGNRTLAPFDGITRIRFKGSVAGATLSAIAAPPHYCFLLRIGLASAKSI